MIEKNNYEALVNELCDLHESTTGSSSSTSGGGGGSGNNSILRRSNNKKNKTSTVVTVVTVVTVASIVLFFTTGVLFSTENFDKMKKMFNAFATVAMMRFIKKAPTLESDGSASFITSDIWMLLYGKMKLLVIRWKKLLIGLLAVGFTIIVSWGVKYINKIKNKTKTTR